MVSRWNWPSGAGLLAVSGVALSVAALLWSLSGADEKARPRRRKGTDDDEDDATSDDCAKATNGGAPKGGRHVPQEQTARATKCSGADARIVAGEKASARAISVTDDKANREGGTSSLALSNGGSTWPTPRSPVTPSWSAGSVLTPRRCQAAMSANEKKELDLMFRHQERQDARSPAAVVDLARAKQARQRLSNRRRREVPSPPLTVVTSGAMESATADDDPEFLAEMLAVELLSEEAAETPSSPERAKKAKNRKPRKRNKNRSDVSQDQAFLEAAAIEHEEPEMLEIEVEAEGASTEESVSGEPQLEAADPPSAAPVNMLTEKSDCRMVCDAAVQTSAPAGTPTTEGFSSAGAPSTRQGSEADDEAVAPFQAAVVVAADETARSLHNERTEVLLKAAVVVAADETARSLHNERTEERPEIDEHKTQSKCDGVPEGFLGGANQGAASLVPRKQRAWADLTDTSDDEPGSGWCSMEILPECKEESPLKPDVPMSDAISKAVPHVASAAEELGDSTTVATSGQSDGRSGATTAEEIELNVPECLAVLESAAEVSAQATPTPIDEPVRAVTSPSSRTRKGHAAKQEVRQDWVMVRTRHRARRTTEKS